MYSKMRAPLTTAFNVMIILLAISLSQAAAETKETVNYETGFYYTVQKGDTLWDLSQKFSDTPWQWPEMWKENDQIANPHRIYPGERIRLYRRLGAEGHAAGGVNASDADKSKEAQSTKNQSVEDKPELNKLLHYEYSAIDRVGFIRKDPVRAHGKIFKVEGRKEMISRDDLVYIRPLPGFSLFAGDKFTIYRTLKPLRDRRTNKLIGTQHYFTGAVEIMIKRPDFVLGKVIASYRPIKIGDLLMPYNRRMQQVSINPSPPGLEASIIESEEHQAMFGENAIAFIDKGRSAGVEPGQLYWIYKQDKYRVNPDDQGEITLTPVLMGELLVLHTENTTATVMITDSRQAIYAGSKIITPFNLE